MAGKRLNGAINKALRAENLENMVFCTAMKCKQGLLMESPCLRVFDLEFKIHNSISKTPISRYYR